MIENLVAGPTLHADDLTLQLLGLERTPAGDEVYVVSLRRSADAPWQAGRLRHLTESSWSVVDEAGGENRVELGRPDDMFAHAVGEPLLIADVVRAVPQWPTRLRKRLARRRSSGPCTVAFEGRWFLDRLTGSTLDHPLLFPGAAAKLGLDTLEQAGETLATASKASPGLLDLVERALEQASVPSSPSVWRGEGRLIGESTWGDLSQVGEDLVDGCAAARGSGLLRVTFEPGAPLGLGFGPQVPSAEVLAGKRPKRDASAGEGLEVGDVEPAGAAERAGVVSGMGVTRVQGTHLDLEPTAALPFEDLLEAIDGCLDAGEPLVLTFDTAAPLTHWYAVEMPGASMLAALGATAGLAHGPDDAGVGASFDALVGDALLWREPVPRVFIGAPGSSTCAHVDICPQVQLAHGLLGTKVLGVASHDATPRLLAEHGASDDEEGFEESATHVPTDRASTPPQAALLADRSMSLVVLRPGDLAVIHSGALHCASNGAEGLSAALYHGLITEAVLPRLREAAAAPGGSAPEGEDAYAGHLFASDLLELVERAVAGVRMRPTS